MLGIPKILLIADVITLIAKIANFAIQPVIKLPLKLIGNLMELIGLKSLSTGLDSANNSIVSFLTLPIKLIGNCFLPLMILSLAFMLFKIVKRILSRRTAISKAKKAKQVKVSEEATEESVSNSDTQVHVRDLDAFK